MFDPDAFLKQEIESASPAKLRFLLLRKAVSIAESLAALPKEANSTDRAGYWIHLREILTELLEGITDRSNPVAEPISDLYIYLLKLAFELEASQDSTGISALVEILKIECETWEIFSLREVQQEQMTSGLHSHLAFESASEFSGFSFEA
jgi:flagellar secretion chaperone FliS